MWLPGYFPCTRYGVHSAYTFEIAAASTTLRFSCPQILHGHDHQNRISQVKKWNLHLTGERGFLESRGPESFMTGFAHQLFVDGRSTQVCRHSSTFDWLHMITDCSLFIIDCALIWHRKRLVPQ